MRRVGILNQPHRASRGHRRFPPKTFWWLAAWLPALLVCLPTQASGNTQPAVQAPLAATSLLLDAAMAGPRIVVAGQRGHILVSDDNGASWKQTQVPTRALLTAVHMHDEHTGWAVGHDAVILRTDDGGDTWRLVHRAPEEERPLLDVWFRDKDTGFAVGAYGYFLATRDGGKTWTSRAISKDDFHLNEIVPAGAERLYMAAEAGVAYRSDDGGDTWRELPSPYTGSWYGALVLDGDRMLLLGAPGPPVPLRGWRARAGRKWPPAPPRPSPTPSGCRPASCSSPASKESCSPAGTEAAPYPPHALPHAKASRPCWRWPMAPCC